MDILLSLSVSQPNLQTLFNSYTKLSHSHNYPYPTFVVVNAISHKQNPSQQITIPISDTFAWNNLIQTHLTNQDPLSVLFTYKEMLSLGAYPDNYTLPRLLSASSLYKDFNFGTQLHCHCLKFGFSSDKYVITALIHFYGRFGCIHSAKTVFDNCCFGNGKNLVTWTVLASLYLEDNRPDLVIAMFDEMGGVRMDSLALSTVVRAIGMLKSLSLGKMVHGIARKCGLEFDVLVSNSLLKMYVDCGSIEDAQRMFENMPTKDVISWNELIRAYVKNGGFNESLKLFRHKVNGGYKPDSVSISTILPACARMTAYKNGKEIHGYLLRNGVDFNLKVKNAIMDMYVKAGCIESAAKVFAEMNERDIISWTVMIMGYSLHGQGEVGLDLFRKIENDSSLVIDDFAYYSVLHACCTARMAEEGRFYFEKINRPGVAHCALLVALLARAGLFDEARVFVKERGLEKEAEVLRALLDGCRIHRESLIAKQVTEELCNLEPLSAENYVLLTNWYADHAKWQMADKCREILKNMRLQPRKAYSWIEFRNKVHVFGTGDVSHPRSERIYRELQCRLLKDEGNERNSEFCLHDVDEERECIKFGHSEMLALSFGLINAKQGGKIRITKNLRLCQSCHDSAKAISNLIFGDIPKSTGMLLLLHLKTMGC
ncbi:hypothetical protein ACFE04_025040 [Oxalis oulophora]